HVLIRAVGGHTDLEIAEDLRSSPNAIKHAWRSIYARLQANAPYVLEDQEAAARGGRRGPEKRRRVIAFVTDHPQELRPFRQQASKWIVRAAEEQQSYYISH